MGSIYALIDPRTSEVRYAGKTDQPLVCRLRVHYCHARKGSKTYCGRWMRQLFDLDLKPTVLLLECTENTVVREKAWIALFRSTGARLTNLTDGGEGMAGLLRGPLSVEHRAKQSAAMRGKKHTEEAKAKMRKPKPAGMGAKVSAAKTGKPGHRISLEARAKQSAALKGRKHSTEHIAKVSAANRGKKRKPLSEEHRAKISASEKGRTPTNLAQLHSPESREKARVANTGKKKRPHTEQAKARMSAAMKGKPSPRKGVHLSDATKAKLRTANLGRKHGPMSDELKRKIGAAISAAKQAKKHVP